MNQDQTDLNVGRGSSAMSMANTIVRVVRERGQVVMKAGGADAIFVALSALVAARRKLKTSSAVSTVPIMSSNLPSIPPAASTPFDPASEASGGALLLSRSAASPATAAVSTGWIADLMAVPRWITEDTVGTLGRESKFLQFNILPCPANGPMMPMLA